MAKQQSLEGGTSCYLSSPASVDTRTLRRVLTDLGVRVDRADELPPPGESLPGQIRKRLREADFVCGVLPGDAPGASNVVFELGIALGLGRPIFIIANTTEFLPFALQRFPHAQGILEDSGAIRFHLRAFLKNMKTSTRAALGAAKPAKHRGMPEDTIAELRRRAEKSNASEAELEQIVATHLQGARCRGGFRGRGG